MTDWIEHHGKGYPDLPMDTLVQVRFADGGENEEPHDSVEYWSWNWLHEENGVGPNDIVAYRVVAK